MNDLLFPSVFIAGMTSFFSPCVLPLMPVYVSMFASGNKDIDKHPKRYVILKSILFVMGVSTVYLILGFSISYLTSLMVNNTFQIVLGIFVILMGIIQMGIFHPKFMVKDTRKGYQINKHDYLGTYLMGVAFSFGWSPCIGPILASVLALAASSTAAGGMMLGVYTLGFSIPFMVVAIFSDVIMHRIKGIYKYFNFIKIIGGIIIILMGILLMLNKMNFLMTWRW